MDRSYVFETGKIVLSDTAENLRGNNVVQNAYLGEGATGFAQGSGHRKWRFRESDQTAGSAGGFDFCSSETSRKGRRGRPPRVPCKLLRDRSLRTTDAIAGCGISMPVEIIAPA